MDKMQSTKSKNFAKVSLDDVTGDALTFIHGAMFNMLIVVAFRIFFMPKAQTNIFVGALSTQAQGILHQL